MSVSMPAWNKTRNAHTYTSIYSTHSLTHSLARFLCTVRNSLVHDIDCNSLSSQERTEFAKSYQSTVAELNSLLNQYKQYAPGAKKEKPKDCYSRSKDEGMLSILATAWKRDSFSGAYVVLAAMLALIFLGKIQ
mmetsp:Transcript_6409/g.9755  ORF Transcript_6409/g.9755 Transcript_6409/m.9755 type:complete len:134 (+) Transcript_6409:221-622(+)